MSLVRLASVLAILFVTVDARAQSVFTPDLTASDLAVVAAELGLDPAQREAAASRLEAYERAFGTGVVAARRRMSAIRAELDGPDDAWKSAIRRAQSDRARIIGEWSIEAGALRDALVHDVQDLLTDEQCRRWPDLERRMRREKTLGRGRLAGEKLDLVRLASGLEPAPPPSIADLISAYSVDLDTVLRARNALPLGMSAASGPRAGGVDADREVAARKAVRDVNFAYAESIAAALSPDLATAFLDRVNRAAFPRVYRSAPIEGRLRAVAVRPELDEAQRDAVADLEGEYLARLAAMRNELREVIRRHEPDAYRRRLERQVHAPLESPEPASGPDPILSAFARRSALDEEIATRLRSLLTPELALTLLGRTPRGVPGDPAAKRTTIEQQGWVMARFDADRDGRLDEDELNALRDFLRKQ